eukprot:CAMPEP_0116579418 /NCGR_PEP_ID=MMETSP0397-20121206/22239_1 /TAXON_ID=216820 /ORGANISM="Cyclophora tenuis, Strain ECT3854" /LENGTH=241 /DNA_ID=CAMNT_0004108893 /DNA_START=81 /DNA_END=806 /DNA_ORIENTATION=-
MSVVAANNNNYNSFNSRRNDDRAERMLQTTCPYAGRKSTNYELEIAVDFLGQYCTNEEYAKMSAYIQAETIVEGVSGVVGARFVTVMCPNSQKMGQVDVLGQPATTVSVAGAGGRRQLQLNGGGVWGGGGQCNYCPPEDDDERRVLSPATTTTTSSSSSISWLWDRLLLRPARLLQGQAPILQEPDDDYEDFEMMYAPQFAQELEDDLTVVLPSLFDCVEDGVAVTVSVMQNSSYTILGSC